MKKKRREHHGRSAHDGNRQQVTNLPTKAVPDPKSKPRGTRRRGFNTGYVIQRSKHYENGLKADKATGAQSAKNQGITIHIFKAIAKEF